MIKLQPMPAVLRISSLPLPFLLASLFLSLPLLCKLLEICAVQKPPCALLLWTSEALLSPCFPFFALAPRGFVLLRLPLWSLESEEAEKNTRRDQSVFPWIVFPCFITRLSNFVPWHCANGIVLFLGGRRWWQRQQQACMVNFYMLRSVFKVLSII